MRNKPSTTVFAKEVGKNENGSSFEKKSTMKTDLQLSLASFRGFRRTKPLIDLLRCFRMKRVSDMTVTILLKNAFY